MTDRRLTRRRLLKTLSLAGAAALSGCSGQTSPSSTPTISGTETNESADGAKGGIPMFRYDAANTGHRPDGTGPTAEGTETWRVETDGPVRSSPAVVDGSVYVSSVDGVVYALGDGGRVRWNTEIGQAGISSPAVVDGTVHVGGSDGLYALAAADGSEEWQVDTPGPVTSSPTVVDDAVYVGDNEGTLLAFERTGAERWRRELAGTTERNGRRDPSENRLSVGGQQAQSAGDAVSTPAVDDGTVYVATAKELYAVDADSGEPQWSSRFDTAAGTDGSRVERLSGGDSTTGVERLQTTRTVPSSPAVVDGVLYVGQYPDTAAVDAASGERVWQAGTPSRTDGAAAEPPQSRLQVATVLMGSPAVADGRTLVGGDRFVGLETESGTVEWERSLSVRSSPAVVSETAYVGTTDGSVVGLDAESGTTEWSVDTAGSVVSSPAVHDGTVYVGDLDGWVYAFE
ncbi:MULTISPECIES: PQQ-binding-like beta-propeller repeat protein [Haloarcula]|uniref:outer membrane protein assembly factor BamB family protein n=1 Tax=Haloarcula TaxID=2237 RepID=UPI0023E8BFBC|nr:PQQ-binding-like beta-propeller repeat protein [Halomicroarcula sp. SHR3]